MDINGILAQFPVGDGAGDVRQEQIIGAVGNGGQWLFKLPRPDPVVVVAARNYNTLNQADPPMVVLRDLLLPALRAK
jgi:hypothetical protein